MQVIGGEPVFSVATAVLAIPLCGARFPRLLRTLVPGALFGMALIAVQLIPGVELLWKSVRHSGEFGYLEATAFSLHPLNLIETLAPELMLNGSKDSFRFFLYGFPQTYLVSIYLGLLPIGLACWALLRGRKGKIDAVGALAGGFLLLSFGSHTAFYTLFYELVPLAGSSRYPSKLMVIVAFCVALLAAWGIDTLRDPGAFHWRWMAWPAAVAVGFAIRIATTQDIYLNCIAENVSARGDCRAGRETRRAGTAAGIGLRACPAAPCYHDRDGCAVSLLRPDGNRILGESHGARRDPHAPVAALAASRRRQPGFSH
jgi:hypothetical protein